MRMFAGATSMVFVVAVLSAGCATGGKTTTGVPDDTAPTVAADALIYINGLS